jgi:hypothetical protein
MVCVEGVMVVALLFFAAKKSNKKSSWLNNLLCPACAGTQAIKTVNYKATFEDMILGALRRF